MTFEPERGGLHPQLGQRLVGHSSDQVVLGSRQVDPLPMDLHREDVGTLHYNAVAQIEGEAEAIEAWSQVGDRGGHSDTHTVGRREEGLGDRGDA